MTHNTDQNDITIRETALGLARRDDDLNAWALIREAQVIEQYLRRGYHNVSEDELEAVTVQRDDLRDALNYLYQHYGSRDCQVTSLIKRLNKVLRNGARQ